MSDSSIKAAKRSGQSPTEIARQLAGMIDAKTLRPGDRLKELDLVEQFRSSRSPVREALRILEAKGLVTIESNRGATVARLSETDLAELLEMRGAMFRLAMRRALTHADEKDRETLIEMALALVGLTDDEVAFARAHRDFLMAVFRIGKCRRIAEFICDTMPGVPRHFGVVPVMTRPARERLGAEMKEAAAAFRAGNADRLEEIIGESYAAQAEAVLTLYRHMV